MKKIQLQLFFAGFLFLFSFLLSINVWAQTEVISISSSWRYKDDGSNQGTAWRSTAFNDASWSSGNGALGFGNSSATTLASSKITYYFRKTVSVNNPSQYTDFSMNIRRDHGIIVYVNNLEVYRNNMPSGTISYNTTASSTCSDDGRTVFTVNLSATKFIDGDNIIAVEVHNRSVSSSDVTFELGLVANGSGLPFCSAPEVKLFGNRNVTGSTAEVYWAAIPGVSSYNVEYRIRNSGSAYSVPINTTTPAIVLTGLSPLTNYEFIVQSVCNGNGLSSYSTSGWITTVVGSSVCLLPEVNSFGNRNATSSSVEVYWNQISGVSSYNVEYRIRNSGSAYSSPINTSSNSVVLTNLQPATNYEFIVQSVCGSNLTSAFSTSSLFNTGTSTTSCITPNVGLFGNRNITGNTAEVYWVAVSGASSYNVEYRIRNSGSQYSVPFNTTVPAIVLTGLLPLTNYEFIVQSVCNGSGSGTFSPSGWFTTSVGTSACLMADVNSFGNRNATSSSVEVYWNQVPGVSTYNVEYRIRNSGSAYSSPINAATNSLVLTNLQSSASYEFIVQSVCGGGLTSAFSTSALFSTGAISTSCVAPNVSLYGNRNVTGSTAEVYWASVSGVSSYNVEYRVRNSGFSYSAPLNTTGPAIVLTGLLPLTNYEFIVQSVCSGGSLSAYSASGWFTTTTGGATNSTTLIRGPYMPVSTSNSITIQWRTSTATNNEVKFGTASNSLSQVATNSSVSTEHSVSLTGLTANTKYYYSIGQIGSVLQGDANNYFYTAPSTGTSQAVKFWVTGDFGNGSSGQINVRNSFSSYTAGQKVNGWLWLGDNAYSYGTDAEYQTKVFDVYNSLFKNIPVFPTPGNHDYGQSGYLSSASLGVNFPYFNIFSLPTNAGTEKYYSTNYANIHFISLDSYGSYSTPSSAMYNWLQNDLATNTQQWTIVYFHHPPYSKGSHNSDTETELISIRNNIIPLLESYGVDLVMSGHSHIYERSNLIKNHTGLENTFSSSIYPAGNIVQAGSGPYTKSTRTGNGTVYVVCGVSGQAGGGTQSGYPHNAMASSIINSYGSLILDVNGGNLTCKFLTSAGAIGDQFTMQKTNASLVARSTGYGLSNELELSTAIYPNPSMGDLNISIANTDEITLNVSVYNLAGSVLFAKTYSKLKDEHILIPKSQSNLLPGVYVVNIVGEKFSVSKRLLIY